MSKKILLDLQTQPLGLSELTATLNRLCDQVEDDAPHASLVLNIDEPSFAELSPYKNVFTTTSIGHWERVLHRIEKLPTVSVCLLNGNCSGAAFELALATDFRIATPLTTLSLGLAGAVWPGMGIHRLTREIGVSHARRATLFGTAFDIESALALGLVDLVNERPQQAAEQFLAGFDGIELHDLAVRRALLFDAVVTTHEDALGGHLAACDRTRRRLDAHRATLVRHFDKSPGVEFIDEA